MREGAPFSLVLPRANYWGRYWRYSYVPTNQIFTPATNEDVNVIESLGLTLRPSGLIYSSNIIVPNNIPPPLPGMPVQIYISIKVYVEGFVSVVARARLDVATTFLSMPTTLIFDPRPLPIAHRLEYFSTNTTAANILHRPIFAFAGNSTVRYFLADGYELPEGFELLQSGMVYHYRIIPSDQAARAFPFRVRAVAEGLEEAAYADFVLNVEYAFLRFDSTFLDDVIERGTNINIPISGAVTPDGIDVEITYTIDESQILPRGLSVVDSTLKGIPERAYGYISFVVEASAEGYTSIRREIWIYIQERMVNTSGVFEAKFVNMRGRASSGGGGAFEWAMLQENGNGGIIGTNNQFFIGWHYWNRPYGSTFNPPFIFRFYSTQVIINAELLVRLAREVEVSAMHLTSNNYDVRVNGTQVIGFDFVVSSQNFQDFILGNISVREGWNDIQIRVLPNNFGFYGGQGAPAFDHIRLENLGSATLTWRPYTYNLRLAGGSIAQFWNANAPNIY